MKKSNVHHTTCDHCNCDVAVGDLGVWAEIVLCPACAGDDIPSESDAIYVGIVVRTPRIAATLVA